MSTRTLAKLAVADERSALICFADQEPGPTRNAVSSCRDGHAAMAALICALVSSLQSDTSMRMHLAPSCSLAKIRMSSGPRMLPCSLTACDLSSECLHSDRRAEHTWAQVSISDVESSAIIMENVSRSGSCMMRMLCNQFLSNKRRPSLIAARPPSTRVCGTSTGPGTVPYSM